MSYLSKEYKEQWNFSKYPPSAYRIFGFVFSKQPGTFNYNKNIVQIFTLKPNDLPEQVRIDNFKKLCQSLFKEMNVKEDLDVKTETDDESKETTITFSSNNICNCLQSLKYEDEKILFNTLYKPSLGTYPLSLNQRIEFILGVYLNHSHHKTKMLFRDNYPKMALTHSFIADLAGEDDEFILTSRFDRSHSHVIEINENGQLWKKLETLLLKYGYQL